MRGDGTPTVRRCVRDGLCNLEQREGNKWVCPELANWPAVARALGFRSDATSTIAQLRGQGLVKLQGGKSRVHTERSLCPHVTCAVMI